MSAEKTSAAKAKGSRVDFDADFLRKLEYLNVVARKIMAGRMRADRQSPRRGTSAEFADHRSYVAGDDIRRVDWHLYGRLEELFIKLYREEENLHFTVLVDASASMDMPRDARNPDKFGHALQIAAALAYIGMANLDSTNVLAYDERLKDGLWRLKGRGKVFQLFDALRELEIGGTTDMSRSFREFVSREQRRGVVVAVGDFCDVDGFQAALKSLKHRKHDIYAIHVVDPREEEPDLRGDLRLVDRETGVSKEINVTDALRERYKLAFAELGNAVETFCKKNEIGYVRARTDTPFDELVLRVLRRGGLLA